MSFLIKLVKYVLLSFIGVGIVIFGILIWSSSNLDQAPEDHRAEMEQRASRLFSEIGVTTPKDFVSTLIPRRYIDHTDFLLEFEIDLTPVYSDIEATLLSNPCVLKAGCFETRGSSYVFSAEVFYSVDGFTGVTGNPPPNTSITIDMQTKVMTFSTEAS